MFERLAQRLAGFKLVGLAFTIFALANLAVFAITLGFPPAKSALSLSLHQPWGVVASIFVHEDVGHLAGNLEAFILWTFLFLLLNLHVSIEFRERMSRIFLWTVFLSGFFVNVAELIIWGATGRIGASSLGSSGIVYAALGVTYASAFINLPKNLQEFILGMERLGFKLTRQLLGMKTWKPFLIGALSIAFIFAVSFKLVFSTKEFLGGAPGVDVLGHGLGFIFGFAGAVVWLLVASRHPFFIIYER